MTIQDAIPWQDILTYQKYSCYRLNDLLKEDTASITALIEKNQTEWKYLYESFRKGPFYEYRLYQKHLPFIRHLSSKYGDSIGQEELTAFLEEKERTSKDEEIFKLLIREVSLYEQDKTFKRMKDFICKHRMCIDVSGKHLKISWQHNECSIGWADHYKELKIAFKNEHDYLITSPIHHLRYLHSKLNMEFLELYHLDSSLQNDEDLLQRTSEPLCLFIPFVSFYIQSHT